jgi:hypothetical protein
MASGARLESLVAIVEETLLPRGFNVSVNKKLYDDNGAHLAEFDIEVAGRLGSTDIRWLIECRDRPSDGPQGGDWIQQLAGRRGLFGFNKITAVSTTGFTHSARFAAEGLKVELREVTPQAPDLLGWLKIQPMRVTNPHIFVRGFTLEVPREIEPAMQAALEELVGTRDNDATLFRASATGELMTCGEAFSRALTFAPQLVDGLALDAPARALRLTVEYTNDDDHLVLDTSVGPFRCRKITYEGDLSLVASSKEIAHSVQYRRSATGEVISDYVEFEPIKIRDHQYSVELHHLPETSKMVVAIKKSAA